MHHQSDIGLVDPHPEGVGGDHDPELPGHEGPLHPTPLIARQSPVVRFGPPTPSRQAASYPLHPPPGGRIDDGHSLPLGPEQIVESIHLLRRSPDRDHRPGEVGAVEALHHHHGVPEPELLGDLCLHPGGGGGRDGQYRRRQRLTCLPEAQVVRPEVVAPLADAVGLVHRHQHDPDPLKEGAEPRTPESFRRHEEESDPTALHRRGHPPGLPGRECGAEVGRRDPRRRTPGDLVGHEGDEGAHHQGEAVQEGGRDLVGDTLSAPGGEDSQGIPPRQDGLHEFPLSRAKVGIPQMPLKRLSGVGTERRRVHPLRMNRHQGRWHGRNGLWERRTGCPPTPRPPPHGSAASP